MDGIMGAVPKPLLHVPFAYVIFITFALPTFSLMAIATLGVYLHFQETTATHCGVSHLRSSSWIHRVNAYMLYVIF